MKNENSKMFSVLISKLKVEDGAPFPLYLFLKKNDRFIPIRLPGDPLGAKTCENLLEKQQMELWIPENFREIYENYLRYAEHTGNPAKKLEEIVPAEGLEEPEIQDQQEENKELSEATELIIDTLRDEELSSEEKAEVLSAVSQDMMRALNQITTRGKEARAEGLKRCKEIADQIVILAAKNSNIYDEILALRSSQEDIEHSVIVGTMAAMFGLAIGFSDENLLADLTVGAIFHDIGLVRVSPDVIAKKEADWSPEERSQYHLHVDASVAILKESGAQFHPRVYRMIEEHHENYDGSGFPKGLQGGAIDEVSAILHLANLFDRICTGKQTGTELSPSEAFDHIYSEAGDPSKKQEVQPELIERIFQFMLTEKEAAESLLEDADARARAAVGQSLQDGGASS